MGEGEGTVGRQLHPFNWVHALDKSHLTTEVLQCKVYKDIANQ